MARGYPFFNKYPYTNFEQLNLDELMRSTGSFDQRLINVETSVADHSVRITALENGLGDLEQRVSDAEASIDGLQDDLGALSQRVSANETDIETINGDIDELQDDITRIDGKDGAQDDEIDALKTRMSDAEDDIEDLSGLASQVQRNTNDISGLDSRVITLEGAKVTANPGGSPSVNLNTIRIGSTDYAIPSGGGGGGTSVTPNPAGTPTDTLDSVDIAGTIYDIPSGVDTSDMIADQYSTESFYYPDDFAIYDGVLYRCIANTNGAWDSTKWTRTTCTSVASDADQTAKAVEALYAALGTYYEDTASAELTTSSTTKDYLPGTRRTLTPGSWLITFNATFDTHELGSKQRGLYTYIDKDGTVIAQGGKYMWGSEAITDISYANSVSVTAVVNVPSGSTSVITPQVRVPVNTGSGDYTVDVRVGYVCIKPIT